MASRPLHLPAGAGRAAVAVVLAVLLATAVMSAAIGGVSVAAARRLFRMAGWIVLLTWPIAFVLALTGWTSLAMAAFFGAVGVWLGYRLRAAREHATTVA